MDRLKIDCAILDIRDIINKIEILENDLKYLESEEKLYRSLYFLNQTKQWLEDEKKCILNEFNLTETEIFNDLGYEED